MKKLFKSIPKQLLLFLFICAFGFSYAQSTYKPIDRDIYHLYDRWQIKFKKDIPDLPNSLYPFNNKELAAQLSHVYQNKESLSATDRFWLMHQIAEHNDFVEDTLIESERSVFNTFYTRPDALFSVNEEPYFLKVNPVIHYIHYFQQGGSEDNLFINTRGFELTARLSDKIGIYSFITDNQYRGPEYVRDHIRKGQAVPGEGFYKNFKDTGVDFLSPSAHVHFNVADHIDIVFGHGRNFIGHGYRSLLLSDHANQYFHLRLISRFWKFRYQNLFAEMTTTYRRGGDRLLDKKYLAAHYLHFKPTHWLELGLFESVTFTGRNGYELQYLNPVILYRAVEHDLGSPDKVRVGAEFRVDFLRRFSFYGQIALDEFNYSQLVNRTGWWANKYAFQTGLKYVDAFTIPNLDLQLEYNYVRPYMFTHQDTATSFTHYNQALAHPLGANFDEIVGIIHYRPHPRFSVTTHMFSWRRGLDSDGEHWGSDIFRATNANLVEQEFDNETLQGLRENGFLLDAKVSYQIRHNFFADLQLIARSSAIENQETINELYVGAGLRLNMVHRRFHF